VSATSSLFADAMLRYSAVLFVLLCDTCGLVVLIR
jgi:hypothetical protein